MTYLTLIKKKNCNFLIMFFLIFSELSFRLDEHIKYFQGFTSSMEVSFYHLVRGVKYSLYIYHHWLITYSLKIFFTICMICRVDYISYVLLLSYQD